uniref:Uncharacterized protein n=1 Tax=Tanacetum cinerariifolium TaxID=118510 RepID=A0A699KY83_TANCI|nr:hypothetical protein [Tanacetum cinerariifolium]
MNLRMPVISVGFQANMSKLSLSRLQSSILPFSDRFPPIVTVCFEYFGWIATLFPSVAVGTWGGGLFGVPVTILHSTGIMDDPPSTYIRSIRCPFTSASITIGFSCPKGRERDFSAREEDLGGLLPCHSLPRPPLSASSNGCIHPHSDLYQREIRKTYSCFDSLFSPAGVVVCRGVARGCARIAFLAALRSSYPLLPRAGYVPCETAELMLLAAVCRLCSLRSD